MTTENLKSLPITNLDATPVIVATSGEGSPAFIRGIQDNVTTTTTGGIGSTYRLARFPVDAKVTKVHAYIGAVDSNAVATWVGDFNVAFSDSTVDGTNQNLQGLIPTSSLNGTTTTVAAYSLPNKLFGQVKAGNSSAVVYTEITFNGATYNPTLTQTPLWDVLGFTNSIGAIQSPGGFFDILVYVSTAAATAHAGILGVEVDYML